MITLFNRKQLCVTFDQKYQADVREALRNNKIDYKVKVVNRKSPSLFSAGSRARTGTIGEKLESLYEYEIYVKKDDFEVAKYLIAEVGRK